MLICVQTWSSVFLRSLLFKCFLTLKPYSLHPMIFRINHMHSAFAVDRQGPGAIKLSRLASRTAPASKRLSVRREFLHPVIAELHHIQFARRVERQIIGIGQFSGLSALRSPAANQLAVAREDLNAMIASIGHIEVVIGSKDQ